MDKLRRYLGAFALALFGVTTAMAATEATKTFSLWTTSVTGTGASATTTRTYSSALNEFPLSITYKKGDTVKAYNPRKNTTVTLVNSASAAGTYTWTGPDAGVAGTWYLQNTTQGKANFVVPASMAAGTTAYPIGVYDTSDLANVAADGKYYKFLGTGTLTAPSGYTLYYNSSTKLYWLYKWPTAGSGTEASPYIINSQSSLTASGKYYAFYGDSLASPPSGYTKANSSGTAVTSVTAPAGWTLYRNSASTIFYLYQWRAAGDGSGTLASPKIVNNSTISSVAAEGLYYTPYGGKTAEIFGDTVSGYTTVYSMGSGSITSITVPSGYKSYVAGDGIFWLTKSAQTTGGTAETFTGNGTTEATASGFHLHTTTVTGGATMRTLNSVSELYPLAYQASKPINVTAPVSGTLMAAQSAKGLYNWTPSSLGTWTLTHVIDGMTYTATFKLGDAAASTDYYLITWKQDATTVIDTTYVKSGTTPTHATPEHAEDDLYVYTFDGWSPSVATATQDTSYTAQWTSKMKISASTVTIAPATQTYTGSALTPALNAKWNTSTSLTLNTDYTIKSWSNNTAAGTASVTIEGKGDYTGTATKTFTINPASVTCPANAGSKTYNGQTQTASITAPAGSSVKTNAGGKNVGAYDVVLSLTSTTNYKWSDNTTADKTIKFNITAKTLTDAMVSGVNSSYTYTGSQIKPMPTVADSAAGITSSDYTVTWGTNTTVAQGGTVTVTAKGNYTGAVTKSFSIAKAEAVVTVAAKSGLVYSGAAQELVTESGLQGGTIAYTLDGVADTSAIPTGIVPKSYAVGWTVTGDSNHSDKSGSVTVAISGTVAGEATITLGSGVTVAIPAGVTVTVSEAQAVTAVTGGKVVVTRGGARAETNGTIAANGIITGEAVYLYGSQSEVNAIRDLENKTLSNGTLKIKADEL